MLKRYCQLATVALVVFLCTVAASCSASDQFALQVFGDRSSVGAEVYVDGGRIGAMQEFGQDGAHLSAWLPHGRHQVEVRRDGYAPYRTDITVEPGQSEHYLQVKLQPLGKPSA